MTFTATSGSEAGRGRAWFIGFGVVLVILGILALFNAGDATLAVTIFVGWLLVIAGIANIVGALMTSAGLGWRVVQALLGVLYVLAGVNVVFDPMSGAIALTIVFGALLIADGILRIVAAVMDRGRDVVWIVLLGIVNILLGLWLWTGIPFSALAIGIYVGIQLLVAGTAWLVAGFMIGSGTEQPAGA